MPCDPDRCEGVRAATFTPRGVGRFRRPSFSRGLRWPWTLPLRRRRPPFQSTTLHGRKSRRSGHGLARLILAALLALDDAAAKRVAVHFGWAVVNAERAYVTEDALDHGIVGDAQAAQNLH